MAGTLNLLWPRSVPITFLGFEAGVVMAAASQPVYLHPHQPSSALINPHQPSSPYQP